MNGSTDYLEAFTYQASGSSQNLEPFSQRNNFSISLVGANQAVEAVTQTTSAYGQGTWPGNNGTPYAVAQLDNIRIWQQGANSAFFYFGTVSGTTQIQGSMSSSFYNGGAGTANINNQVNANPLTITTAGVTTFGSGTMSCWTANFRDLTANISYRATFILAHGYVNSQCFLERIGGQQI
jgi:hypothetical protein